MTAKRKNRVTFAGRKISIYKWQHPASGKPGWRFSWRDAEGKRRYVTRDTLEAAEAAALAKLQAQDNGSREWLELPEPRLRWLQQVHRLAEAHPDEEHAVLQFLRNRRKSGNVVGAVDRFGAFKTTEAGEETPHLRTLRLMLEAMAQHFATSTVADIHAPELTAWWTARGKGLSAKRRKDIRSGLVSFWKWAQGEGIAGTDAVTVAARLPNPKLGTQERRVLSPEELQKIMVQVRPEWRAWVILGAFAGLRPEEIAPSSDKVATKRGLRIEEIDWKFNVIRLPAEVSKAGKRPRNIPLNEACRTGLEWAGIQPGMTGAVVLRNPSDHKELERLGKLLFGGKWPQDALRHSYGSCRNAMIRNLPQVAEEMGNSVEMLHRHYHNPRTEEEGTAWFAVRPPSAICGSSADHRPRAVANE